MALKDIDLKYKSGALTTTKNLTLSGSGASLAVGGNLTLSGSAAITGGLILGGDTNLYRGAADRLQTDDALRVGGTLTLGSGGDVNLYRSSADVLRTDDSLVVGGSVTASGRLLNSFQPSSVGYKAVTLDGAGAIAGNALATGVIYLCGLYFAEATTVTDLWFAVNTQGTLLTAGQNWVGMYSAAGSKLTESGLDTVLTSTGPKQITVSSFAVAAGLNWVTFLANFTGTAPQIMCGNTSGALRSMMVNGPATAANYRFANNGTGTVLPSSITPASNTAVSTDIRVFWAGAS